MPEQQTHTVKGPATVCVGFGPRLNRCRHDVDASRSTRWCADCFDRRQKYLARIDQPPEPRLPPSPPRMTQEAIHELARRYVTREVFIGNSFDAYRLSFGVILAFADMTSDFRDSVGAMWAEMADAGPMAANGYPIFYHAHFIHRLDLDALLAEIKRLEEALRPL